MNFISAPDDHYWQWTNCRVSENNYVRIGVYRVMFGFRVRAGFCHDSFECVLDWCGGGNWKDVERLYSLCVAVLSNRDETPDCFDGLPRMSRIKPFYLDQDFVKVVGNLAGDKLKLLTLEKTNAHVY